MLSTLQHISIIYREGCPSLLPFASFLSKFPNDFAICHTPKSVLESLHWWELGLLNPDCSCPLKPHQFLDPDLWVDASKSWDISVIYGNIWFAWTLMPGWKAEGRDIGWATPLL